MKKNLFISLFLLIISFALKAQNINDSVYFSGENTNVSFTLDLNKGCAPLTVNFTNTSTEGVYFEWYFGDDYFYINDPIYLLKSSKSDSVTKHIFENAGYYYVQLYAYDENMNFVGYAYNEVIVSGKVADFYVSKQVSCPNSPIYFNLYGYSENISWDFGDGQTETGTYVSHIYEKVGNYKVVATIESDCGTDTLSKIISINENHQFSGHAEMYISSTKVCPKDQVSFYAYSDGIYYPWDDVYCINAEANFAKDIMPPYGYSSNTFLWNFGDGITSDLQMPTHSYTKTGNYLVSLKITDECGNDTILFSTISVSNNLPIFEVIDFYFYPEVSCLNENIQFYSNLTNQYSMLWNFGDGVTSKENYPTHSYSKYGQFPVALTVTNGCGAKATNVKIVEVSKNKPFDGWIDSNVYPAEVCPGETVECYVYSSESASYLWDFGDGTTSENQYEQHVYEANGEYLIKLKLTNFCGSDTIIFQNVVVDSNKPVDDFYAYTNKTISCPNDGIEFGVYGNISSVNWDFGDGTTSDETFVLHSFSDYGTYEVKLTATNQCGNSSTKTFTINITNNAPVEESVYAEASNYVVCPTEIIQFYSTQGYSYEWNFGDETIKTDNNFVEYSFDSLGTYEVKVKIINSCGNDTVLLIPISVEENIYANTDFEIYYNFADSMNVDVEFKADNNAQYLWDFGDGTISTDQKPIHNFVADSLYQITLTVTNYCGYESTVVVDYKFWSAIEHETPQAVEKVEYNNLNAEVYPNPSNGIFSLSIEDNKTSDLNVQIYNIQGQQLDAISEQNEKDVELNFDLTRFEKGIYFVKIAKGEKSEMKKLIIQ